MDYNFDIAVIGGGAAGFAAAISAARCGAAKVAVLEAGDRVLKKLSASGNGQGNIANTALDLSCYHGSFIGIAKKVFGSVGIEQILKFYSSCGIECAEQGRGRVYPRSLQASAVTDRLRLTARGEGVTELTGRRITAVRQLVGGLRLIQEDGGEITVRAAIAACGGAAYKSLSGGTGYQLFTAHGHGLSQLMPSLVRLTLAQRYPVLSGIRISAAVTLSAGSKTYAHCLGDVQFSQYGISGNAVFELSGKAVRLLSEGHQPQLVIDFMPDIPLPEVKRRLEKRFNALARETVADALITFIPKQLAVVILSAAGVGKEGETQRAAAGIAECIAQLIKGFRVTVTGSLGLENAQVTAGGLLPEDFSDTLMSLCVQGLFACGEMLDIDGDCGGYNIMWATASGIYAGQNCTEYIQSAAGKV